MSLKHRDRLFIETALRAAVVQADPAEVANELRMAGVLVCRDPRGAWFADKRHPATMEWLAALAGVAGSGDVSEIRAVMRRIERQRAVRQGAPATRGTGRHIFPEMTPRGR